MAVLFYLSKENKVDKLLDLDRLHKKYRRDKIRNWTIGSVIALLLISGGVDAANKSLSPTTHLAVVKTSSIGSDPESTPDSSTALSSDATDPSTSTFSNEGAQTNADQSYASNTASVNATDAQDNNEINTINAEAQAANQAAAADDQAAAQDLANANNANNTSLTPAEQAAVKANAARLQCIAQANGQYETALDQLDSEGGTRGLSAAGVANKEASLQNQFTSATNSCNNQ